MPPVPQASSILASLGQAAFRLGSRRRRHRLERECRRCLHRYSAPRRWPAAPIRRADRAVRVRFAPKRWPSRRPARGGEGVDLPDRIWRPGLDLRADDLDRGDRLLVRRRRRQAGARARHRPHQQRAPCPRRTIAATVAARSADRRTQSHPSRRRAGGSDRGNHRASARPAPSC